MMGGLIKGPSYLDDFDVIFNASLDMEKHIDGLFALAIEKSNQREGRDASTLKTGSHDFEKGNVKP